MVIRVNNPYNLKDSQIDRRVQRVKIILTNAAGQVLLCRTDDGFSFVGGHINAGETPAQCLKRELEEETGITLSGTKPKLFLKRESYEQNYFSSGQNVRSTIYYYLVQTEKTYMAKKMHLDPAEKQKHFSLMYVSLDELEQVLREDPNFERKQVLYIEMLDALILAQTLIGKGGSDPNYGKIY